MNLHDKSLKLAGLYLSIIMLISLFFSANIYRLSVSELEAGIRKPRPIAQRTFESLLPEQTQKAIQVERENMYEDAKDNIISQLVTTNIFILITAGFLSYYLALKTLKPIEDAREAQNRFTADASHELRTPIAAMQTETEVTLMNPKLNLSQAKAQLGSNLEELAKLTSISEGLLSLARLENSYVAYEKTNIIELLHTVAGDLSLLASEKNIAIKLPKGKNITATIDRQGISRSLTIVTENAIKYSSDNSEISIGVKSDKKYVTVQIKDTGMGIDPADMPHIFDRFYRADKARTHQKSNGYGLGLAIAKDIIIKNSGEISAAKNKPNGTVFTIKLPVSSM